LHEEEVFYKFFKISRIDFLTKLEQNPDESEKIILKTVYSQKKPNEVSGRHGVLSLDKSIDIIKRKWIDRERDTKFAKKFVGDRMTPKEFR
jgi:hypothetical protein